MILFCARVPIRYVHNNIMYAYETPPDRACVHGTVTDVKNDFENARLCNIVYYSNTRYVLRNVELVEYAFMFQKL